MAGGPGGAGGRGAVVDVLAATGTRPAVDADADVAPPGVEAGAPVAAGVGLQVALVHVLGAELAWGGWWEWGWVRWGSVRNLRNLLGEQLRRSQGPSRAASGGHLGHLRDHLGHHPTVQVSDGPGPYPSAHLDDLW